MPYPAVLLTAEDPEGLAPGLEGLPWWFVILVLAFIVGTYMWNSRRRRDAADRHMSRDEWEAHLRANDPDMKSED